MKPPCKLPLRPAPRGRPSKTDALLLRARIQATARKEFREHGYAATSIDAIARAAAVSRTTIYALYSDKRTLFNDMIQVTVRPPELFEDIVRDDRPPEVVLREAMVALNAAYYRASNIEIIRLCIAEVDRFPDLIEDVRERLALSLKHLCAYLVRLRAEGRIAVDDCWNATLLFNMLALGSLKPLLKQQDRMTEDEATSHIEMALGIFLRGCFVAAGTVAAPPESA